MKKIISLVLLLVTLKVSAQFSQPQNLGGAKTAVNVPGLLKPQNFQLKATSDTLHSLAVYNGLTIKRSADGELYIANGTYWEKYSRTLYAKGSLYWDVDSLKNDISPNLTIPTIEIFRNEYWTAPTTGTYDADGVTYNTTNGGTLVSGTGDLTAQGVITIGTGTAANGISSARAGISALRFGGGEFTYTARVNVGSLSNATQGFTEFYGFFDVNTTIDQQDGAYFLYDSLGTSANMTAGLDKRNWLIATVSNNTRTFAATTVPVAASTWVVLKIVVNAAASSVTFYINDVLVGTATATIPTGSGRETSFGYLKAKSVGTTAATTNIDYMTLSWKPTSPR